MPLNKNKAKKKKTHKQNNQNLPCCRIYYIILKYCLINYQTVTEIYETGRLISGEYIIS